MSEWMNVAVKRFSWLTRLEKHDMNIVYLLLSTWQRFSLLVFGLLTSKSRKHSAMIFAETLLSKGYILWIILTPPLVSKYVLQEYGKKIIALS